MDEGEFTSLTTRSFSSRRDSHFVLQEPDSVPVLREKIKTFLASQGMIKGHSGPGPRNSDQQPQILILSERVEPRSPPTPTLSTASSSEGHRSPVTSYVREGQEYSHIPMEQPTYSNNSCLYFSPYRYFSSI